jgi:hypothetical protein
MKSIIIETHRRMRASAHRINIFFVCKRFFMIVNHFISKNSIWIRKIFDLRFNMKDKTSCHIRVFTSFWSFRCAIEINLNNELFERVWLRLRSLLKLLIVKYTNQVARSFWCWDNIVLSEVIRSETMIVLSKIFFCVFHYQSSICIFVYILSLSSLNWQWMRKTNLK